MNKQQFKQARLTLNLSCDKFAQELGLKGKYRERHIRRIGDFNHPSKPSANLIKNAKILLELHEMKNKLIKVRD